jgi:glycerol-3-phosphate dehydrogenase (NAD(P)+)
MHKIKNISVIGDGSWGTTLSIHLAEKGYPIILWGAFAENIREIQKTGVNAKFLPGICIPPNIFPTDDLNLAIVKADLIVLAVPSQYARGVLKKIKRLNLSHKIFLSVIKGIENTTLLRMSQVIKEELGDVPLAVLSGPTIAMEVAKGIPSTAVIASREIRIAKSLQKVVNSDTFRIYTNPDMVGVELAGSLKNIIALACGVCDGLGFGTNTKAAILSRGLVEIARLGKAMGAHVKTFSGLAGLGDLVTTCGSSQSRNRYVGEQLGKGRKIHEITSSMSMVAEGVVTVKAAVTLSRKHHIAMPITSEVYHVIYKGKKPEKAVSDLMRRKLKQE